MTSDAQRRANAKQDATRNGKRVAIWLERDGPEDKALKRLMRKFKMASRTDVLRWLLMLPPTEPPAAI